jgi:magnesium chelatase subunit D
VIDTSPRPDPAAAGIAAEMAARYLPMPYAGALALTAAVRELA